MGVQLVPTSVVEGGLREGEAPTPLARGGLLPLQRRKGVNGGPHSPSVHFILLASGPTLQSNAKLSRASPLISYGAPEPIHCSHSKRNPSLPYESSDGTACSSGELQNSIDKGPSEAQA
jgi:hypothetical protein